MDDNFTCSRLNFNAVTEGQILFVTEGHNLTLPQLTAHSLRSGTLILCYIQTLEPNL